VTLAPFTELLSVAEASGHAVGAFTCYDLETAGGVLAAAADRRAGVILLIGRESFAAPGGVELVAALRALAEIAPVPVCLQLDHVSELSLMGAALDLGVGALMADGSRLPDEENSELVARACELARQVGAGVEAELGHVAGDEDVAVAVAAGALTDPAVARRFTRETGAACLAVSIGNVHGRYASPPRLDWDRLAAVRGAVDVPLSLHGASGLADADVRRAVAGGVRKVNVNTELRVAYLDATTAMLPQVADGLRLLALHDAQTAAVRDAAAAKLDCYGSPGA
jgi:ketose-bisphosphate aldolase